MSASQLLAFDVMDYGATGDGSTDDTYAIQQAINAAKSAGGGTVFLPRGSYKVTSTLTVTGSNIHFWGLGESHSLIVSHLSSGYLFSIQGANTNARVMDVSFRGLRIAMGVGGSTCVMFLQKYTEAVTYQECRINSEYTIWELGHTGEADSVKATNILNCNVVYSGSGNCISLVSGAILVVRDCFFNGAGYDGSTLIGQTVNNRNWDGLVVAGNSAENYTRFILSTGQGIVNARITENICEPDVTRGTIALFPYGTCRKWVIANNVFTMEYLNGSTQLSSFGVKLSKQGSGSCSNFVIANNVFHNGGERGVDVADGMRSVVISGNHFIACGRYGVAISIGGSTRAIAVTGNVIDGQGATHYGIGWGGSGTDRSDVGNVITDVSLGARIGTA